MPSGTLESTRQVVAQDWESYSPVDHWVWRTAFERRGRDLASTACHAVLAGMEAVSLPAEHIPDIDEVNRRLEPMTGWRAVPVTGFLPVRDFFAALAERTFPTTVIIRPPEQLDYTTEPDVFHDLFGHVPLHADASFADFLQRLGALGAGAPHEALRGLARLFWFTAEFGLIREDGDVRLLGSGLISSGGEAMHALSDECVRHPFDLDAVLEQRFETGMMQDVLFVIESFDALFRALETLKRRISRNALSTRPARARGVAAASFDHRARS